MAKLQASEAVDALVDYDTLEIDGECLAIGWNRTRLPGTQITVAMIPEPSTALLLGLGLAALASRRGRRA